MAKIDAAFQAHIKAEVARRKAEARAEKAHAKYLKALKAEHSKRK